jgi:hypothetical protein
VSFWHSSDYLFSCITAKQKLLALVDCANAIIESVETFWESEDQATKVTVGGDELLPILIYVVIKGALLPQKGYEIFHHISF